MTDVGDRSSTTTADGALFSTPTEHAEDEQ